MTRGIWAAGVLLSVVAGTLIWFKLQDPRSAVSDASVTAPRSTSTVPPEKAHSEEARQKLLVGLPEARLADDLNSPSNTVQQDLAIVGSLFAAYRSIYSGKGNPIGDNREITDSFLSGNPKGIPFLRAGNRAINSRGELCDRWGTPLFFHAESGLKMEIRSAGADRTMWTPDDVAIIP